MSTFLLLAIVLPYPFAFVYGHETCNCVVFRLDDIEDTNFRDINMAIMKSLISKGIAINVAIIGNKTGEDSTLINFMKSNAGMIVFANHGWSHENFALYTNEETAMRSLKQTNDKIEKIFGTKVTTFMPPSYNWNSYTIQAMRDLGMKTLSGNITDNSNISSVDIYGIKHYPSFVETAKIVNDTWSGVSAETTFQSVKSDIAKYGYDVITMHAYEYAIPGTEQINQTQINQIPLLIDKIIGAGYVTNINLLT
jgi:peptidoglycan/xylan/chitin deacetylase (PgdA/CDA1 family)